MLNALLSNRFFQILVLGGILCLAVLLNFSDARWRDQIRNFTFDNYNILKPREPSGNIVIVDIDEASLRAVGQMPWPRNVMAKLVENLRKMGAVAITFDIVFAEPDRTSPEFIGMMLEEKGGFDELQGALAELPDNDAVFGQAIKDAGNVITGFSFTNEETGISPRQIGIFRGKNIEKFVTSLRGASANLRVINKYAAGNGSFFVSTDTDGIIRRVPMLVAHTRTGGKVVSIYPSLSLETLRVLSGQRGGKIRLADPKYAELDPQRFGILGIEVGKKESKVFIPTNASGEFPVYFAKSNQNVYISAQDVLAGLVDPAKISGKVILIGTSAVGLKDIRSTPLDTFVAGVEVHANIIDQVLQGKFLKRSIEAEGMEAIWILAVGLIIILVLPFFGVITQFVFVSCMMIGTLGAGWHVFKTDGLLIDVTYPVFSFLFIFMMSNILTYLRSETDRRAVKNAFGHYVSKDLMSELTKDPDKLSLGGEIRDLSVMFTDIRKFTSICEGLTPEEIIQLMNDFLTPMTDLVMQNRGTIDKYMGDAMMAFWNAPLDDPDHARHACIAALGMQNALEPINEGVKARAEEIGKTPVLLRAGIGINTGPCAVGNMGSKQRFAYSTLGDPVNLASRLEGQTKTYGVGILIGEATWKQVQDFACLELDLIQVIGKQKPERVFVLLGDSDMAKDEVFQGWKKQHDALLESYRNGDFQYILDKVSHLKSLSGQTLEVCYDLYAQRATQYLKTPPPKGWDGVYIAKSK